MNETDDRLAGDPVWELFALPTVPSACIASVLFAIAGFALSAILTAWGLLAAFRSGMRIWVGEGVNRARALFLGMLLVGSIFVVLVPLCSWMITRNPRAGDGVGDDLAETLAFFGCWLAGPLGIVLVLDWVCRRVIADRPGKFGAKVPAVGKWNS
jgi:hypothetical protein